MPGMHADLEEVAARFELALARRTASDCQQHPRGDARRWNAQQNVAHLVLTYKSTNDLLRKRLELGQPPEERETLTQRFLQWFVIGRGIFPKGAKAPEFMLPDRLNWPAKPGTELMEELRAGLVEMDRFLDECEAKFGSHLVGKHFIFGPLTPGQWRRLHRVHGLHHLKQVKAILRQAVSS